MLEHFRAICVDYVEQIIEIVSHPTCQLPDALQLLGVTKLGFEVPELRKVAARAPDPTQLAIFDDGPIAVRKISTLAAKVDCRDLNCGVTVL